MMTEGLEGIATPFRCQELQTLDDWITFVKQFFDAKRNPL
jgi:hypothetical protein